MIEKQFHINVLEHKAILFAVQAFELELKRKHIKVYCDNTIAMTYVSEWEDQSHKFVMMSPF